MAKFKVNIGEQYIQETFLHMTELRLRSLMSKTYEKAIKNNGKKNYHIDVLWSVFITICLAWLSFVFKTNKELHEIIFLWITISISVILLVFSIILTIKQFKYNIKQATDIIDERDKAINEVIESINFADEDK